MKAFILEIMTTFLLNLLLFLGIVWMLLGMGYFGYQMWQSRKSKQESSDTSGNSSVEDAQEVTLHDLVGKSRPFVSPPIPEVPAVSSQSTPERGRGTFVEAYAADGIGKANAADEIDEDEVIREDLSLSDEPLPEVSPTAILSRDLARVSGWSRNDDALDEESLDDVRTTLQSLRGTDLMEKYKAYLAEQERDHRKLLAAIRRSEEAEVQTSEVVPTPIQDENTDDKPLSYYL
jgi:hypothetical protein